MAVEDSRAGRSALWTFLVASLGWMFDTFDQRLFVLVRAPAMAELLVNGGAAAQTKAGTWVTALFVAGWATGGIIFGVYGDRLGRVRTMSLTILIYSLCTGLSALTTGLNDFALLRFLTGVGIGGEFAAGTALIAETMPARLRPYALGLMQAVAMFGTMLGTVCTMFVEGTATYAGVSGWRWLLAMGALPALLLIAIRLTVTESPAWERERDAARVTGASLGGLRELFKRPWLRISVVGAILGFAGQSGIWAIGTWTPELMRLVLNKAAEVSATQRSEIIGTGLLLKDVASFVGILAIVAVAQRYGRKAAFAASFILSLMSSWLCFAGMRTPQDIYWMMPLIGFSVWSVLGAFAVYFAELFPTRLRASGIGLCYNISRFLTAGGVLVLGELVTWFSGLGYDEPLRPAALLLSCGYLVGLAVLWLAPETKDQPLPV